MPNGIPHCYQLDQSISVLRLLGCIFHFYQISNRTVCKQTVENLIRSRVFWSGSLLFAYSPTKRTLAQGGGGDTLIFSYIRRLGPFLGVQNFEFQYFWGVSEK